MRRRRILMRLSVLLGLLVFILFMIFLEYVFKSGLTAALVFGTLIFGLCTVVLLKVHVLEEKTYYSNEYDTDALYQAYLEDSRYTCEEVTENIDDYWFIKNGKVCSQASKMKVVRLMGGKYRVYYTHYAPTSRAEQEHAILNAEVSAQY